MNRDLTLFLKDILDAIDHIEKYCFKIKKSEFEKNEQLQDAIARRIEIIGEATKNVPESFRQKYPSVLWKKVAGMRDVVIHAYYRVLLDRIWNVVQEELPELKKEIKNILDHELEKSK